MKIHYTKKRLKKNLIQGCGWILFGLAFLWIDENRGIGISWILLSMLYFGTYFYERQNHYLTLENGFIQKNKPFSKPMALAEIRRIKKFAGDYILLTDSAKMTINTQIIAPASLEQLDTALSALELPPQLTPFSHPS